MSAKEIKENCLFWKINKCSILKREDCHKCSFFKENTYENRKALEEGVSMINKYLKK